MYFCNIVSSTRIYQFIALYNSVKQYTAFFNSFVLCMDETVYRILKEAGLEYLYLTKLEELEDEQLLKIKKDRRIEEYCWTLKPIFLTYIIKKHKFVDRITYLDSDLFFYQDPMLILDAYKKSDVLLSEHDFSSNIKHIEKDVGRFNAGFICFKNNFWGRYCLRWWKNKCISWCYNSTATGQFGDQKYLDDLYRMFKRVHRIELPGVNIAPWNEEKYKINLKKGKLYVDNDSLILYHYCGFRLCDKNSCVFMFGNKYQPIIHNPYMDAIRNAISIVETIDMGFDGSCIEKANIGKFSVYSLIHS